MSIKNPYELDESYTEILKLDELLTDAGIDHELSRFWDGWQIIYYKDGVRISDAIEHYGSYGHEEDLLEIMGLVEIEDDTVEGYLTADEVFKRYYKHFKGESN